MIIHGGKFGKVHVAKCGKYLNAIRRDNERCIDYIDGIASVTCKKCIANHKPGKC